MTGFGSTISPSTAFDGRSVLITGAAAGIGQACARRFAECGATVWLSDVADAAGIELADELGPTTRYRRLNVRDEFDWCAVISEMAAADHPIDVLVNSAGAASKAPLIDTSLEQFREVVDLNLTGTFLGVRSAGRAMAAGGSIINIASVRGVVATAGLGAYGASKFGVRALTKVAAIELAQRGIRVNAVCPGSIDTAITAGPDFASDDTDAYIRSIPMQRRGTPNEVAAMVLFLAGGDSSYVTGADMLVDGGTAAGVRTPTKPRVPNEAE